MSVTAAKGTQKVRPALTISGLERTAVIFQELGEHAATAMFGELDEHLATRISVAMANLGLITPAVREDVMVKFREDMAAHGLTTDSLKMLSTSLTAAFGERTAKEILSRLTKHDPNKGFKLPANAEARTLAIQMERERPQVIALLMAHLPTEFAAEMLAFFPEVLVKEIVYRFSRLGVVAPNAVTDLQNMVDELIASAAIGGRKVSNLGGPKMTADILNQLDSDKMSGILADIEGRDIATADAIKENLFTFADLLRLNDKYLRVLIQGVNDDLLHAALRLAEPALKQKILENVSQRKRDIINEELTGGAAMRRQEVLAAQAEIVQIAIQYDAEGKISIKATEELI